MDAKRLIFSFLILSFLSSSHQLHPPLPLHAVSMPNAFPEIVSQSAAMMFSSSKKYCYDVFINHRGKDVKLTLASTIYHMLDLMGVHVFLDEEELEVGDSFPQAIEEAMSCASIHIVIFSPNYAESPWCLEELSLMLQFKLTNNVTIIPVFYGVDPSDVRYAKGKYADEFVEHGRKGRYTERIEDWEKAMSSVSYLKGFKVEDGDMGDMSRKIAEFARGKVTRFTFSQVQLATLPDSSGQFSNLQYQLTKSLHSFAEFPKLRYWRVEQLTISVNCFAQFPKLLYVQVEQQLTMSAHSSSQFSKLQYLQVEQLKMSAHSFDDTRTKLQYLRVDQSTMSEQNYTICRCECRVVPCPSHFLREDLGNFQLGLSI